jgi:hypothetical protein
MPTPVVNRILAEVKPGRGGKKDRLITVRSGEKPDAKIPQIGDPLKGSSLKQIGFAPPGGNIVKMVDRYRKTDKPMRPTGERSSNTKRSLTPSQVARVAKEGIRPSKIPALRKRPQIGKPVVDVPKRPKMKVFVDEEGKVLGRKVTGQKDIYGEL